ncbi:MAG: hypothetical protein A3H28_17075 [Acidobacteria bacterium RIFCSPLOWO2_02_FULL_61_28]|nr:MAG: hypothetical protein A3H28_17075 [Acidobacteria bacterium RIFCSPLOWO2_02_FULL_61_28]
MSRLILLTANVLLLATVAVAPAAGRSRGQKPEQSWDNLKKLRVGEEIQVVYQEEQYLNGKFLGFTPAGISVQWGVVNKHDETILRKEVIRVIASRPSQRAKNTLIGLGAGALIGTVASLGAGAGDAVPKMAGVFGGLGAVAGALSSPDAVMYQSPLEIVRAELRERQATDSAQDQRPEPSWDNLRTLRIFQKVRVLDQRRKSYDGKFLSVSDEAIFLDAGRGEVAIRRADVLEVKAERPRTWGQSGSGIWADTVTVYRADPWVDLGSSRGGSISREPACGCSSETTTFGSPWERECDRETTRQARRERKRRDSHRSRKTEIVITAAPVSEAAAAEVPSEPVETENPTEQPQPETELSESATPDSAEPPAAEEPSDAAPVETETTETETPQSEESEQSAGEEK